MVAEPIAEPPSAPTTMAVGVIVALACVYVVWGSTYLAMRVAIETMPPFGMASARFLIAGGLLYAVLRLSGTPPPTHRQWGGTALVGALLLGGGNGGVVFAQRHGVASGLAALGVAVTPLFAAIFAGLWGQWPTRREWLGTALGLVGIVFLNLDSGMRASPIGAAALLLASASWAFGSVWGRRLSQPLSGLLASAMQMLAGGGVLLGLSLATRENFAALAPSVRSLSAFVYLIFGAWVGFSAYVYLLRRVRPALATSYAYVNPIIAVALGALLVHEPVTASALLALVLIVAGVALVALTKKDSC